MSIKNKNLYCCFSIPQRDYLTSKGVRYELFGLNPNTKNMFWVYMKTEELNRVLKGWSSKIN